MNKLTCLSLATLVGFSCIGTPQLSRAQVVVNVGPAPECPYGYYDYEPYPCAPYGYYGPEWFSGGIFIGAGPWFHGRHGFYGHVNNRFDGRRGFRGPFPNRGERADPNRRFDHMSNFHGNEMRDGHGHTGGGHVGGGHGTGRGY